MLYLYYGLSMFCLPLRPVNLNVWYNVSNFLHVSVCTESLFSLCPCFLLCMLKFWAFEGFLAYLPQSITEICTQISWWCRACRSLREKNLVSCVWFICWWLEVSNKQHIDKTCSIHYLHKYWWFSSSEVI